RASRCVLRICWPPPGWACCGGRSTQGARCCRSRRARPGERMAEPPFGHESSAIAVRRVLVVGAVVALTVTLVVIAVWLALGPRLAPARRAALSAAPLPPAPRLQAHPATDLATVRQRQRALLEGWGWTDAEHR